MKLKATSKPNFKIYLVTGLANLASGDLPKLGDPIGPSTIAHVHKLGPAELKFSSSHTYKKDPKKGSFGRAKMANLEGKIKNL